MDQFKKALRKVKYGKPFLLPLEPNLAVSCAEDGTLYPRLNFSLLFRENGSKFVKRQGTNRSIHLCKWSFKQESGYLILHNLVP